MREGAGAGRGEAKHLKAVCERARMAALAAIFDIVMDRVVVGRDRLERGEIGIGDGSARDVKALAERQILEISALRKPMLAMVEAGAHAFSGRYSAPSAASPAILPPSRPSAARISRPCSPML